jgi:tetratricopeptide (TPR) repeat protein
MIIGQHISHYRVISKLGEGGMGIVYRAHDITLDREVALKFLPPHSLPGSEEQSRFLREARAAASLDHPNICPVYEVGEADGQTFIAMAFVDGVTLKERVSQSGPLPVQDAADLAGQIASGLQAAHEKGIVHRDVKSANIMVSAKGQARIMDFGLAKAMGGSQLTVEGMTLGTIAYMSPEQARGEPVDFRTDIWALGIVIYEMLAGKVPFASEFDQAVVYSILNESPRALTELRDDIPASLLRVVARSLEKNPDDRYQSIENLIADLSDPNGQITGAQAAESSPAVSGVRTRTTTLVTGIAVAAVLGLAFVVVRFWPPGFLSPGRDSKSIVVADCENGTDDHNLAGISGLLITSLEQSHRLSVMSRSSMFEYLRQLGMRNVDRIDERTGREICSRAGTQLLVVPSVQKLGERYVIEVKLLDPARDEYLFTDKVDGIGVNRIYPMIDEIAERTRRHLLGGGGEEKNPAPALSTFAPANLEAYQHYFQAEQLFAKMLFRDAEMEYRKAITLDTSFALAYVQLARSLRMNGDRKGSDAALQGALRHVDRAPEKQQEEIRAATATNADERVKLYSGLTEKYPDEAMRLFWNGDTAFHRGHFAVAVPYFEKVLALDPSFRLIDDAMAIQHLIWSYRDLHQYDTMVERAEQFVAMVRTEEAYDLLGDAYALKGDLQGMLHTYSRAEELYPGSAHVAIRRGEALVMSHDFPKAETTFRSLLRPSRPDIDRREGWRGLARLFCCEGKFRDAYGCFDSIFEIDRKLRDSLNLMMSHNQKAFWLMVGWRDSIGARREIEDILRLEAQSGHALTFGLRDTYIAMHEIRKADSLGSRFELEFTREAVKAYAWWSTARYDSATWYFQLLTGRAHVIQNRLYSYDYARLLEQLHRYREAVEVIERYQSTYHYSEGTWCAYYPRSFFLLGRICEEMGDRKKAEEATRTFLTLWKNADRGLPEVSEARKRMQRLGLS